MLNIKIQKMIDVGDWDALVIETYQRPYSFQQQDGCKSRGVEYITVPTEGVWELERDTIPEIVNGEIRGVSFAAWLARDPKQPLIGQEYGYELRLWWERNFYPTVEMIVNDLYSKGLIEAGEYVINIDW